MIFPPRPRAREIDIGLGIQKSSPGGAGRSVPVVHARGAGKGHHPPIQISPVTEDRAVATEWFDTRWFVVEVTADSALLAGRHRHALRYVRRRPDLVPEDLAEQAL